MQHSKILSFLQNISDNFLHLNNPQIQQDNILFLLTQDDNDNRLYSASIAFKNTDDDDLQHIDAHKFTYIQILETIATSALSELHNGDACSFAYHFDSQHATDPIITASITDYFS